MIICQGGWVVAEVAVYSSAVVEGFGVVAVALVIRGIIYHAEYQAVGAVGYIGFVGGLYGEEVVLMSVGLGQCGAVDAGKAVEYGLRSRVANSIEADKSIVGVVAAYSEEQDENSRYEIYAGH